MLNFLIVAILSSVGALADEPSLRVSLMLAPRQILKGQNVEALIEITNKGKADVEIPRPNSEEFNSRLIIDNKNWGLAGRVYEIKEEAPTITLKPGVTKGHTVMLAGSEAGPQVNIKVGIKLPSGQTIWSNPATFSIKDVSQMKIGMAQKVKYLELDSYCFPVHFHVKGSAMSDNASLDGEQVIQTQEKYMDLLKIRRGRAGLCATGDQYCQREQHCSKQPLPLVNFAKLTVLANYSDGNCATKGFKREVFKDVKTKVVNYIVETEYSKTAFCSGPGMWDLNLIAVPKIPSDYKVNFHRL